MIGWCQANEFQGSLWLHGCLKHIHYMGQRRDGEIFLDIIWYKGWSLVSESSGKLKMVGYMESVYNVNSRIDSPIGSRLMMYYTLELLKVQDMSLRNQRWIKSRGQLAVHNCVIEYHVEESEAASPEVFSGA